MNTQYTVFLIIFIIFLSVFAYIGARGGFIRSLYTFLRIAVPMLLSGIIVKIAHLIPNIVPLVSYIIGGIGTVIFFLLLQNVIVYPEKKNKLNILDYFFGFILGIAGGWLIAGFFVMYIDYFSNMSLQAFIPKAFFVSIIVPVKLILFLELFV